MRVPKRRLFTFVIAPDLAAGLKAIKERDGISESEQARRAIAAWLEGKGVKLKKKKGKRRT